eukprot:2583136-Lingulodinium_polyedra.AAC.1
MQRCGYYSNIIAVCDRYGRCCGRRFLARAICAHHPLPGCGRHLRKRRSYALIVVAGVGRSS